DESRSILSGNFLHNSHVTKGSCGKNGSETEYEGVRLLIDRCTILYGSERPHGRATNCFYPTTKGHIQCTPFRTACGATRPRHRRILVLFHCPSELCPSKKDFAQQFVTPF